jgi:hypothetical protein
LKASKAYQARADFPFEWYLMNAEIKLPGAFLLKLVIFRRYGVFVILNE